MAQHQKSPGTSSVGAIPPGTSGASLSATATDTSTTANSKVCYDAGYSGSTLPIAPDNIKNLGRAFISGSRALSSDSVPATFTLCSRSVLGAAQADTVTPIPFKDGARFASARSLALKSTTTLASATVQQFSKSITNDVPPSGVTLSPGDLQFGNVTFGSSADRTVTLTNTGTTDATGIGVSSTAYPNPNDFIPTQNCPASLAPNATCQISVTFVPDGVGPKSGIVNVFVNSLVFEVPVSGTGTGGVLQVNPGNLKTIAGNGTAGSTGDGGLATAAELNQPNGIAFDPQGNLYIVDQAANVVRKVDTSGQISTFAGTGTAGYSGDGGAATKAELNFPWTVAADKAGNIYIQDALNNVIRKVDVTGTIVTYAGTGTQGYSGDGGDAVNATFYEPDGARFDTAGNYFITQCGDSSVRKIDTTGNISTVAGNFTAGYSGDGGAAIHARLSCPSGVAIDPAGNFYIADYFNHAIRKVDTAGIITTFAGNGTPGFKGDGGPAKAATLNLPDDIVIDASGNLYVADTGNNRIRKIDARGIITTVAGGLNDAGSAGVNGPLGVGVDARGNVYFTDTGNSAVRELFPQGRVPFPDTAIGSTSPPQTVTLSNIGNVPIVIPANTAFTLGGNAKDFALSGGTCLNGATLSTAQDTCTVQISFTPTAAGPRTLTVSVADNALNSPQNFTLGGNGTSTTSMLQWTVPASIVYGTPLSAAQLNAKAVGPDGSVLAGTFVYTPALGTVLTAGSHSLSVVFTPAGNSFLPFSKSVPITVTQAVPAIAWTPNPSDISYGTPLSAAQLDATSAIPGTLVYTPALGAVLAAGPHVLSATFTPQDTANFTVITATANLLVGMAQPVLNWMPDPAAIIYGTALSAAQLDATSAVPGTFVYTPALGASLAAGAQSLSVAFTPTDAKNFKSASATATILVKQATPTIAWPSPASILVGSALTNAQLNATATGVSGAALPGTFTYIPAAGTLLPAGTQTLKVVFSPTDLADYTTSTATVPLQVVPLTLTSLSSMQAALGDPAKTITLTGTGFVSTAIVLVNGSAISTTFVNPTTLTATIPAANFLVSQVLEISVVEAAQNQTTASLAFLVGAPLADAVFTAPSTIQPGTDTDLGFSLVHPYPVDLTATFTLSFTPASGLPNDPGVVFANGESTYTVVIPAEGPAPLVAIQGSTVAGSMTVTLSLHAGGVDVTPPSVHPLVIQAPLAVPEARSASVTRSGNILTVVVHGLSDPRDMTSAKFHFIPAPGRSIETEDVTIDVVPIFTAWYADPASLQYGSTFTYTQTFSLSSDASVVGQVSVTLTNSVGVSQEADTP